MLQGYYKFLTYANLDVIFLHFSYCRPFLYCLLANAISGAKLVKMFEEAKFRCVKVQFFSGSVV